MWTVHSQSLLMQMQAMDIALAYGQVNSIALLYAGGVLELRHHLFQTSTLTMKPIYGYTRA